MEPIPTSTEAPPISSSPPESPKKVEYTPDCSRIAQDLQIRKVQVENVIQLLKEGFAVPFIARFRHDRIGGLTEDMIRAIQARAASMRQLADRRQTILRSIEGQGKLSDELRQALLAADTIKRLEDLYAPFKPKKRTPASLARERGLEPFAQALWDKDPAVANLQEVLAGMVNPDKQLASAEDVLEGVHQLLAERCSEIAEVRAVVRRTFWETGKISTTRSESAPPHKGQEFKDYFTFSETLRRIPPHRILAINRGEKENILKVKLEWDAAQASKLARQALPLEGHPHADILEKALTGAIDRILAPFLEREIRRELMDEAQEHALRVFSRNLRSLLLQPPMRSSRLLAIDPGARGGCRLAVLDEAGQLLDQGTAHLASRRERGWGRAKPPRSAKEKSGVAPASPAAMTFEAGAGSVGNSDLAGTAATVAASCTADSSLMTECSSVVVAATDLGPVVVVMCAQDASGSALPEPVAVTGLAPAGPAASEAIAACPPASPGATKSVAASPAEAGLPPVDEAARQAEFLAEQKRLRQEAKARIAELVAKHNLRLVAIGNGPGCRELEELVAELIAEQSPDLSYVLVNEAGVREYAASAVAKEEFPDADPALRGTISIGRRLQDPLGELVKIDPPSIGVGLYQQDLHPKRLRECLEAVFESCVNHVGVDLNKASVSLLGRVAGLNPVIAREIVSHRQQHGPFKSRQQLLDIPAVGQPRYTQAAGFLRVSGSDSPLDETWLHPDQYECTHKLLGELGMTAEALRESSRHEDLRHQLRSLDRQACCARLGITAPNLEDISHALLRLGRDPRDDVPAPVFKKGLLKLENLQPGMELKGTVLNVVDFGAFVDVGLKDSGLVHISQIANRFIKNPYDVIAVGDVVTVWVLTIDKERQRVSLTMIRPGTERKPPEKGKEPGQGHRGPAGGAPRPPRRFARPASSPQGSHQTAPASAAPPPRHAPPPPARPRKPHRAPPRPKLSQAALEGDAPLRTFSELKAFFEAHTEPEKPRPAPTARESEQPSSEPPPAPPEAKP